MPNAIKKLRTKNGLTQDELAAALQVEKIQLSRWERNWDVLPEAVVKDLATLFNTSAAAVLGAEIPVQDWHESPYAINAPEEVYGSLDVWIGTEELSYPISVVAKGKLCDQLGRRDVGSHEDGRAWLSTWTLNNLALYINPRRIRQINVDADTLVPHFSHPEVYRAMELWEEPQDEHGPILRTKFKEHLAAAGDNAADDVCHFNVRFHDGRVNRYYMTEWSLAEVFALEANSFNVEEATFLEIMDDDGDVNAFINLDDVALIEVPADKYHKLMAPH